MIRLKIVLLWLFLVSLVISSENIILAQELAEVRIGSKVVIKFHGKGSFERARIVQGRIDSLLRQNKLSTSEIRVLKDKAGYSIYWGEALITTADPFESKFNKISPDKLAVLWSRKIKKAFIKSAFYIVPSRMEISSGGKAIARIRGFAKGEITMESIKGDPDIDIAQAGDKLIITAPRQKRNVFFLTRSGVRTKVVVLVKEMAAKIPIKIETSVSGKSVHKKILQYAAKNALRNYIKLKPGAKITIGSDIRAPLYLKEKLSTIVHVPVKVEGKGLIEINREIPVIVRNNGVPFPEAKKLMVSDRPESIKEDGILFKSSFSRNEPTRLLFYHLNSSKKTRNLWIEVENPSLETVKLQVNSSWAGPDRYGIIVGHQAALRFLEAHRSNVSYNIFVYPRKKTTLVEVPIPSNLVLAGYIHMNILEGDKLKVRVLNCVDKKKGCSVLPVLNQPFDPFKIHPKGDFNPANIKKEVEYEVGQEEEASCVIGKAPWLIDAKTGEPNNGNYGVFYKFKVMLKNPTNRRQRVGFFFIPDGLRAQGTFIFDGELMETEIIRKPNRKLFAVKDLMPGEEKEIELITTPEGGSYYPARVLIKMVGEDVVPTKARDIEKTEDKSKEV